MSITDQELARFLWEHPRTCAQRGLHIAQSLFANGRHYRRLSLGACGVAQQVSVCFDVGRNVYYVQLLYSTTQAVTVGTYRQAQQQLAALRYRLVQALHAADITAYTYGNCVLIGQQVLATEELAGVLASDSVACWAYTYRCGVDGLRFEPVVVSDYLLPAEQAALDWLGADLLTERVDALSIHEASRSDLLAGLAAPPSVELADLVVTPAGVLAGRAVASVTGQLSLFPAPVAPGTSEAAPGTSEAATGTIMADTIGQRLTQLAQHVGGGKVAALARVVGVAAPVLYNAVASRNAPGFETLHQILTALPQVRPAWLLLGQGPMLASSDTSC